MISDWMENESLTRKDQVLNVMYDLRIFTRSQLVTITGLGKHNVDMILKSIRRMSGDGEGKEDWLQAKGYNRPKKPGEPKVVYSLGMKAIRYVQTLRGLEPRSREAPSAQTGHFIGINDILMRSLERYGHDRIGWYSEMELAVLLYLDIKDAVNKEPAMNAIIRPDGMLLIDGQRHFVEFDNATEGPRKLETKFSRYIDLYEMVQDYENVPILWVANTEKRLTYIKNNWEITVSKFYAGYEAKKIPKCLFAVAGEESEVLDESMGKLLSGRKNVLSKGVPTFN